MEETIKKFSAPKNDKAVETIFIKTFSKKFYEKYVKYCLKYFKISYSEIKRIHQYISVGHSFICLIVNTGNNITPLEINLFEKGMRNKLKKSGYSGRINNSKFNKTFGNSRKAIEPTIMWKSSLFSKSYCLLFERFSEG